METLSHGEKFCSVMEQTHILKNITTICSKNCYFFQFLLYKNSNFLYKL